MMRSLAKSPTRWSNKELKPTATRPDHPRSQRKGKRPTTPTVWQIRQCASDWKLSVNLKRQLVFPQDVAVTSLRPNIVLLSRSTKAIIAAELTVPWEEELDMYHQLKKAKYQNLIEAVTKGWHATI